MSDRRKKDINWIVADANSKTVTWDEVQVAVMMDLRDELKKLNALLHCHNTIAIPAILRRISSNTANLPKVRAKAKPKKK